MLVLGVTFCQVSLAWYSTLYNSSLGDLKVLGLSVVASHIQAPIVLPVKLENGSQRKEVLFE